MRPPHKLVSRYMLVAVSLMGYLTLLYLFSGESCHRNNTDLIPSRLESVSTRHITGLDNADTSSRKSPHTSPGDARSFSQTYSEDVTGQEMDIPVQDVFWNVPQTNNVKERESSAFRTKDMKYSDQFTAVHSNQYFFDCSNIHLIRLRKKVGEGVSKQTYLGEYHGHQVAVKMVTRHQADVKRCLKQYTLERKRIYSGAEISPEEKAKCYIFPTMKLMKEILILQQLDHANIVKLLGFCVRSEESQTSDLSEHGVIVVEEYGNRFILSGLQILSWQTRLKHARDLSSLLFYLEHSPLGSLIVPDFKETHFLMSNDTIKLIDFDDVSNLEPPCSDGSGASLGLAKPRLECDFNLPCQMAMCVGRNAKINLKNTGKLFFKRLLLPGSFPEEIADDITDINVRLDNLSITAEDLYFRFNQLLKTPILEDTDG